MARRGISQMRLAEALGMSQPAISARLRGATPFDINELTAIAEFFGMPVAGLLPEGAAA